MWSCVAAQMDTGLHALKHWFSFTCWPTQYNIPEDYNVRILKLNKRNLFDFIYKTVIWVSAVYSCLLFDKFVIVIGIKHCTLSLCNN
jgi:hypothetical protein